MSNPNLVGGVGSPQSIYESSTVRHHGLGTLGFLDERAFRYASSSSAAVLTAGQLVRQAAEVGNHISVAWASGGTAGSNKVTVTLGATAASANQYADGWLAAIDGTGSNQLRRIRTHPAAALSTTLELTLYDNLETSFAAADEISLIVNTFSNLVVHNGADTRAVGVPAFNVPIGSTTTQYFWVQTTGPAMMWGDASTFVQGDIVVPADATADAGQVTIIAGTQVPLLNVIKRAHVGVVISAGDASDLDYHLIWLTLEG